VCIVSELSAPSDAQAVSEFVQRLGWITIADPLSQLRTSQHITNLLTYGDLTLLKEIPPHHQPDTILHIGGRVVSKRVSGFLGAKHGARVVHLSCNGDVVNPHAAVWERYVIDPGSLREVAVALEQPDAGFVAFFRRRDHAVASVLESVPGCEDSHALTEPGVLRVLLQAVPHEQILTVGNSMPIRDFDMFARPRASAPFVIGNRGASGIDGVVATGIGAALSSRRDGTIVVGDLSMLHDLNSLALLKGISQSITIVVINNDGGGIFSLLPVAQSEHFERNFATPHGLYFEQLAAGFSVRYARPSSHREFLEVYRDSVTHRGATLLEVTTSREENAALHRNIHSRISEVLE
jgi:2-succinyl-5-enolpyruvyl-6-hydroxy-3-cyclohexene-1-carboxylate synthase